jgi:hypothetical protein
MAYKHVLAPGRREKAGATGGFWMRAEWAVCAGCGGDFWKTHNARIYCNDACSGARPTASDRLVMNNFIATCQRYRLLPMRTFQDLTGCDPKSWWRFSKPEKYGHIGKERKDRFVMVLKKFLADVALGWYDVEERMSLYRGAMKLVGTAKRRMTPGQPHCPMKFSHCRGALLAPDCPRQLRDCPMSGY